MEYVLLSLLLVAQSLKYPGMKPEVVLFLSIVMGLVAWFVDNSQCVIPIFFPWMVMTVYFCFSLKPIENKNNFLKLHC